MRCRVLNDDELMKSHKEYVYTGDGEERKRKWDPVCKVLEAREFGGKSQRAQQVSNQNTNLGLKRLK